MFTNVNGAQLTSETTVSDDEWHTLTLTHYYAQARILLYLDKACVGELRGRLSSIADVTVGDATTDVSRTVSEVFFWRAGMTPEEIAAVVDGAMLKSSLEIYVPTGSATTLDNLAMSLNTVSYGKDTADGSGDASQISSPYEGVAVEAGEELYLYNVESGLWLQENNRFTADWNTRGELGTVGFDVELKAKASGWQINPKFGHNQSMNGSNWYLDTSDPVTAWTFEPVDVEGISNAYYIRYNGKYLHASPEPEYKLSLDDLDDLALWQVVTREQRVARAQQAETEAGRDLSFLIRANEFTHEDTRKSLWTLTDNDNGGANWNSGRFEADNRENSVFEAWNMTRMNLQQTVSDLPAGRYEVQAQAAYSPTDAAGMNRADLDAYNDGTLRIYAHLYANDEQTTLPTVYTEQYAAQTGHYAAKNLDGIWIMDGVNQFSYSVANNPETFLVKLPVELQEAGDLTIGIRVADAPTKTIWVLADKFRLHYVGPLTPTGISEHQSDATAPDAVYTLQGRRLTGAVRPGLYIVGGRKVVVK